MANKVVKGILTIMLVLLIGELGMSVPYEHSNVKAEGMSRKTALNKYEQVNIGGSTFTSLGSNKFLSNSNLGNLAWSNAGTTASAYKNNAIFSAKEKLVISSTALPTKADIGAGNNNTAIATQIPKLTGNWWLQDVADQSYTRAYVNASNIFNAGRTESYQGVNGSACSVKTRNIIGGLVINDYNAVGDSGSNDVRYKGAQIEFFGPGNTYRRRFRSNEKWEADWKNLSPSGGSNTVVALPLDNTYAVGDSIPINKIYFSAVANVGDTPGFEYDFSKISKVVFKGWVTQGTWATIFTQSESYNCGVTLNKGTNAATRPLASTNFNLFSAYTAPDTSTGSELAAYPASGSGTYNLQVIDNSLKMALDTTDSSVNAESGNLEISLEDIYNSNGEIEIPYDVGGSTYSGGTSYISAMVDDQHYKKLGLANENSTGKATLNINNIAKTKNGKLIPQTITLNLYQEEITEAGHLDYISPAKPVTIKIIQGQSLKQATDDPTSTTYGTPLDLHFRAVGNTPDEAIVSNEPITYTLPEDEAGFAEFTKNEDGSVTFTPKTANKTIHILVNKSGGSEGVYKDAAQLTIPIQVNRKNITITAQSYDKELGDEVPVYALHAGDDDLVVGDTIPIGITPQAIDQAGVPTYTPTDSKLMTVTSSEGAMLSVIENGTASKVIAFKEKYNVSYVSGRLKVVQIQADSSWLDISPPANEDGWNDTDVVIKLSEEAAEKGFTKMVMNENAAASQEIISSTTPIILDNSTSPPKKTTFTFYKDNGGYSSTIDLPRDIKIDKVAPELNASDISITQDTVVTNRNSDVHVTFRTKDKPESGSSGLKNNGVTYSFDGTTTPITAVSGLYSFIATKNGTYTLTATDMAGNVTHQDVKVHIPKVIHDLTDVNTYPDEKISLAITAEFSDTEKTGRSYQWYRFKDGAAPEPVGSAGTIDAAAGNADIDFPYNKADVSYSGNYACLITDGDGFYTWSSLFELRVINNAPISSLVMIPKDIQLSKESSDSKIAQTDFEIALTSMPEGVEIPQKKFYIKTDSTITLRKENSLHTYVIDLLYQQTDGTFTKYIDGDDIATFFYKSEVSDETPVLSQKIRLVSNIEKYHDPGEYSGTLSFTIRYGGESTW